MTGDVLDDRVVAANACSERAAAFWRGVTGSPGASARAGRSGSQVVCAVCEKEAGAPQRHLPSADEDALIMLDAMLALLGDLPAGERSGLLAALHAVTPPGRS